MQDILIAPSILSADFTRLADAVAEVEAAGADLIHVDVMDGTFVPNLTIGPPVIKALKRVATVPLDVHLMISNADETVGWYLEAGADFVTVHVEACRHLHRVAHAIRSAGIRAGVALNPATPVSVLHDIIGEIDVVLIMSVNPGFGGQSFIPGSVRKVAEVAEMSRLAGADVLIEVDGGINSRTAPLVAGAGARVLVAGNAIFCADSTGGAIASIRESAKSVLV